MTDLSLDHDTVAAQLADKAPRDPWLVRRDATWGASDVPALLLAYDPRPDEVATCASYHREDAEHGRHGVPRLVARKAGLTANKQPNAAMTAGTALEADLIALWRRIDGTIADVWAPRPARCVPYVDRYCPCLAASPDRFADDIFGRELLVEAKCTFDAASSALRWYYVAQVQAQLACIPLDGAVVVVGPGWANPGRHLRDAPVVREVARDEKCIERIRRACIRAWEDVLKVRERRK